MQVSRDTKYAFKAPNGATVMLLDDIASVKRWYEKTVNLYGPMMPRYTLHKQTIVSEQIEMPNV